MSNKTKYKPSDFICLECANVITLQRTTARQFPLYTERAIWCPICKKTVEHMEVQNADLIKKQIEFNGHQSENEERVYQLMKNKGNKKRTQL